MKPHNETHEAGNRVGVVLAGGRGTRLRPVTCSVNKHLLPVFDKPMIYHPISMLMMAGIRDIVVVTNPDDIEPMEALLGDGSAWGIRLRIVPQSHAGGLAHGLLAAEEEIAGRPCCLVLGDNVMHFEGMSDFMREAAASSTGATILGIPVPDPRAFGVVECDEKGAIRSLEEKPAQPRSNLAIPGVYFFDEHACRLARDLRPSARGELEITDLNREYFKRGALRLLRVPEDCLWLDTGTLRDLHEASVQIEALESAQSTKIGSPDVEALHQGWIDGRFLQKQLREMGATHYTDTVGRTAEMGRVA